MTRLFNYRRETSVRVVAVLLLCVLLTHPVPANAGAPPGTFATSWVGNTFSNETNHAWVPDFLSSMFVDSNGAVFTSGYAEYGGGGLEISSSGGFVGRYGGFNGGFGDPCDAVVADGSNVYYGTKNGVQRFAYGGSQSPNATILSGNLIEGLALHGSNLYISDYTNNIIRVYSTSTMTQTSSWSMTAPGRMTVDGNGRIWVIQFASTANPGNGDYDGYQVYSFSSTGTPGPSITNVTNPQAIAMDNQGRLMVGGLDQNSQVRIYTNLTGTPSLATTFGNIGGIEAGTAGLAGPQKFHWIKGLGCDSAGDIYVACNYGAGWGQSVEKYNASGSLLWAAHGFDYVDTFAVDPNSETDIFDAYHHHSLNYSLSNGGEWSFKGLTVNRWEYPNDDRVLTNNTDFRMAEAVRWIYGKKFLFVTNQSSYNLWVYKFKGGSDGETASMSVKFTGGGTYDQISTDSNGNGQFDSGETANGLAGYYQYNYVDSRGDVLRILGNAEPQIVLYPCQGLDSSGNPIYNAGTAISWARPAEFAGQWNVRRIVYDNASDIMYIGGDPPSGQDSATRICAYTHWSNLSTRTKIWDITVPTNDTSYTPDISDMGGLPAVLRVAGNYVFIAYGVGWVRIHDKNTGAYLGELKPSVNGYNAGAGSVDSKDGMTVYERSNGEYIISEENAGRNNSFLLRWTPPASGPTPYTGTAVLISSSGTTTVEAENYDKGGEGAAYHDTNNGGSTAYRSDNIGVGADSGASNGYNIGYGLSGEWGGLYDQCCKRGIV